MHPFLIADLLVAGWLLVAAIWPGPIGARIGLLSGHGAMLGVLLSAVTGRMLDGHLDAGTIAAAVGLIFCPRRDRRVGTFRSRCSTAIMVHCNPSAECRMESL